jgi:hypothetical protein
MPTDWKSIESIERLVAAIIASNGGKVSNQAFTLILITSD